MKPSIGVLTLLAVLALPPVARSGFMIDPVGVTTNMGTYSGAPAPNYQLVNLINQSGLSAHYTSGVTDFDSYIAAGPTHASSVAPNTWVSQLGTTTGYVDFNLGGNSSVGSLALWNLGGSNDNSLRGFTLLASADSSFASSVNLGNFTANLINAGPVPAQVFTFSVTPAAYVRMQITSNYGSPNFTAFGEAAFGTTAVPEPSSLTLCGIAGLSVLAVAKARRTRVEA